MIVRGPRDEIVLSIVGEVRGFDPKTGKELWKADGLSPLVYTSAIVGEGVVFGSGGFGAQVNNARGFSFITMVKKSDVSTLLQVVESYAMR